MGFLADLNPTTAVLDIGGKLIDKFWPDPTTAAAAKLELYKAEQAGNLEEVKVGLSVMLAEASSTDPWTSRARPSFLYVVYILLLMGVPMGFLAAWKPEVAVQVANGFKLWLTAIPDSLYLLFGTVMTGYGVQRTIEKVKGVA
jgi:hypothetical protein